MARGYTAKEIAGVMDVSVKTVDTHRGKLLRKLGVRGNVELVAWAFCAGITNRDDLDAAWKRTRRDRSEGAGEAGDTEGTEDDA